MYLDDGTQRTLFDGGTVDMVLQALRSRQGKRTGQVCRRRVDRDHPG
ncbi:MAG: hypothetical protein OJF47_001619 [Nitrospira sp.]|nr:MAG: hypothetical protein OJF47_001619 [Nitrospira sp.]